MKTTVRWQGKDEFLNALREAVRDVRPLAVQGVGSAALRVQETMRRHLEAMIYAQPPAASGYQRTGRLRRSTHAARPDADHSSDHDAALSSDLAARDPRQAAAPVEGGAASEVGSWIDYSEAVHEGVNQPSPRPFMEASVDEASAILEDEMRRHAERVLRAFR